MNNYDQWKQQVPDEIPEYECPECGCPVDEEGKYCSDACWKASQL